MKRFSLWVALPVVVMAIGCGPKEAPPPPKAEPPLAESAKTVLADMISTGRPNSGVVTVQRYVASLRKSDPAKADAIGNGLKELMESVKQDDPEAVKAKAKEVADKL
jgi:hypothetical protein